MSARANSRYSTLVGTPTEMEFADRAIQGGWEVSRNGWPDFLLYKEGRTAAVEVKSSTDRLRKEQVLVGLRLNSAGLPTYLYRPGEKLRTIGPALINHTRPGADGPTVMPYAVRRQGWHLAPDLREELANARALAEARKWEGVAAARREALGALEDTSYLVTYTYEPSWNPTHRGRKIKENIEWRIKEAKKSLEEAEFHLNRARESLPPDMRWDVA